MENILQMSAAELEKQGTFNTDKNLVQINNCIFKRGVAFNLQDKEKIIESYKIKSQNTSKYLLVEDKYILTVWSEEKINLSEHRDCSSQEISSENLNNPEQKILTKKITKRYRGQTYEVVVPDLSDSQEQNIQPVKKRLKYRGKYID